MISVTDWERPIVAIVPNKAGAKHNQGRTNGEPERERSSGDGSLPDQAVVNAHPTADVHLAAGCHR
jgi:hypothetical protein